MECPKAECTAVAVKKNGGSPVRELKKIWSYKKQEDGTLVITSYKGSDLAVNVPDQIGRAVVTAVGKYAFSPRAGKALDSVRKTRRNIEHVELPETITVLEGAAFSECTALKTIDLPDGLEKIGIGAFAGCTALAAVHIPESVAWIGDRAFAGTPWLKEQVVFYWKETLTAVDSAAIEVDVRPGTKRIGIGAFSGGCIERVCLPEGLERIEINAFYYCQGLKEIVIPEGVQKIEYYAFGACESLVSVQLPDSLRQIDRSAFALCPNLTIYAHPGSCAEEYARENNIRLEPVKI